MRNGIRGEKVLDRSEKPPPGPLIEINARSFPLFPSDRPLLRAIKNIPLVLIHIYIYIKIRIRICIFPVTILFRFNLFDRRLHLSGYAEGSVENPMGYNLFNHNYR